MSTEDYFLSVLHKRKTEKYSGKQKFMEGVVEVSLSQWLTSVSSPKKTEFSVFDDFFSLFLKKNTHTQSLLPENKGNNKQ